VGDPAGARRLARPPQVQPRRRLRPRHQDFCAAIGIDPWRINPAFDTCSGLDFHARTGEQELADKVATMLDGIRAKYKEYGVSDEPFVVVKADAGTYGMGVMTVKDAAELIGLNRKQRNKMSVVKEGLEVHDVIIQEGVHTFETLNGAVAEPVVYMMDHYVVGGFYRVHTQRGRDENLNAPGMHFEPLAFEALQPARLQPGARRRPNRFYAYGVVARLALLAASVEIEETAPAVAVEA
jgi:glutamate--cysteine ligase